MTSGYPEPQLELEFAHASAPSGSIDSDEQRRIQQEHRYRRILARKQQQGDLSAMAACYIRLGDLLLSRGDSEEAGEHYRSALNLSRAAHERRQAIARG